LKEASSPSTVVGARASRAERQRARRLRWIVRLGVPVVRLLGRTWRFRLINNETGVDRLRRERTPIVFALWHGDMLPLLYHHRGEGVSVLISEHRDGELIARVAESLGFRTVRGSTTRGASRALIGLARELEAGHDVAITPDGPRGPARSFAPGALIAAQRAGAPVVAVGVAVGRAWRLRSWDRFSIPKPFTTVRIAYSDPVILESSGPRQAALETERFEALMGEVERLAHA
jgi:lysophospholipid acyltransferase (LPLAT)-like uncharacterized protein